MFGVLRSLSLFMMDRDYFRITSLVMSCCGLVLRRHDYIGGVPNGISSYNACSYLSKEINLGLQYIDFGLAEKCCLVGFWNKKF